LSSPLYNSHKNQATHNEQFVNSLSPPKTQYPDWVATGAFYVALHYVNASAAKLGIDWQNFPDWLPPDQRRKMSKHYKRVLYIRKYFRGLFVDYNRLLTESLNARYDPFYRLKVNPTTPDTLFQIARQFNTIV